MNSKKIQDWTERKKNWRERESVVEILQIKYFTRKHEGD